MREKIIVTFNVIIIKIGDGNMGFLFALIYIGVATFILVGICNISVVHEWLDDTFKDMD